MEFEVYERPVLSETEVPIGEMVRPQCDCGRWFDLWWNGGELDEHLCECGLLHKTEHRRVVHTVRDAREA